MSEFKGTKGKWVVCKTSGGIKCESVKGLLASAWSVYDADNVEKRKKGEGWLDMRKRTEPIRELKKKETSANAQLISKAPEMLEMLEKVLDHLTPEFPESSQKLLLDEIKQLIKEATTI